MADSESVGGELDTDGADDLIVSLDDVLNDEQQLQDDANAVLGVCDDNVCTYSQGYVPRQALYACETCSSADRDPAGVCLACSLTCHDGHQLTELYTKRNFRCDCGNSKFSGVMTCKLCPDKEPLNDNIYSHNFRGLYCTCSRPYPDPEDSVDDVMLQCVICEDWFHGRHLGVDVVPDEEDFDEVVCEKCLERCQFIRLYANHFPGLAVSAAAASADIDVTGTGDTAQASPSPSVDVKHNADAASVPTVSAGLPSTDSVVSTSLSAADSHSDSSADINARSLSAACAEVKVNGDALAPALSSSLSPTDSHSSTSADVNARRSDAKNGCLLDQLTSASSYSTVQASNKSGAVFWKSSWRQHLCQCSSCLGLYDELRVTFLLNESDTIAAYEEQGKQKTAAAASSHQQGIDAFISSLGRVQQIELLLGYSELKAELIDYLKKFAENGKVVREEDIAEFFDQLRARKRQKTSESAMQYYCK